MITYKNTEIAHEFNIAKATVTRWIDNALEKKNNLQLEKVKNKFRIVRTEHNKAEMLRLSEHGVIYRNKSSYESIEPKKEFYEIFDTTQIVEMINSIKTKHILPTKLNYIQQGANLWADNVQGLSRSGSLTGITKTNEILNESVNYLLYKTSDYKKINLVDIGCGNGLQSKELIDKLMHSGKLAKYIAVDISQSMIDITSSNLKTWFPTLSFDSVLCDVENEQFADKLFESKNDKETINIVMMIGETIGNLEDRVQTLKNIRNSLDNEDIFVLTAELEKNKSIRAELEQLREMPTSFWIPELLGLDLEDLEIRAEYNDKKQARVISLRPIKDYTVNFSINGQIKELDIAKAEDLEVLRYHTFSTRELTVELAQAQLELIQLTTQKELTHALFVCQTRQI